MHEDVPSHLQVHPLGRQRFYHGCELKFHDYGTNSAIPGVWSDIQHPLAGLVSEAWAEAEWVELEDERIEEEWAVDYWFE